MRRVVLLTAALACAALVATAASNAARRHVMRWPLTHLELGITSAPGSAATIAALAPFELRYQYLSGGVNTGHGWRTWNANDSFVSDYIAESEAHALIPVFSYYQLRQSLPGAGVADETNADLHNLDDPATMRAYFADLIAFLRRASHASGPVILQLEPDLFGYVQQNAAGDDAASVPAAVAASGIPALHGTANTAAGFARAVLLLRNMYAPRVLIGYHISIWGTRTDILLNHPSNARVDLMARRAVAFYRSLHAPFDLTFTELADRDSGYAQTVNGEQGTWWHAIDFAHDVRYLAAFHRRVRRPIVMWQIPVGNTVSALMNNTPYHYQDNKVQWLLGPDAAAHLRAYARAGVVALLFGGGQAQDTDIGAASGDRRADDGGYLAGRARAYYRAGAIPLPAP